MVQIILTHEEAATLRNVLSSYVSDLRMEVANTDSRPFREHLKRDEAMLKKLLQQLDTALAAPGAPSSSDDLT
ncbi:MAG TPA: hypothetical protein VLK82_09410 [Candidatus Tectomicrobia bacterium]|nr:hypothetical protein [Candidatus Tectomicrobia bacterium]